MSWPVISAVCKVRWTVFERKNAHQRLAVSALFRQDCYRKSDEKIFIRNYTLSVTQTGNRVFPDLILVHCHRLFFSVPNTGGGQS